MHHPSLHRDPAAINVIRGGSCALSQPCQDLAEVVGVEGRERERLMERKIEEESGAGRERERATEKEE